MDLQAIIAALSALVVGSAVFFFVGRKTGRDGELRRQHEAKSTADELSKRMLSDAEREAENLKKSAVVSGKEEVIRLREAAELDLRSRRQEVEREERRVVEKESVLDRKVDLLEQRDKEIGKRASDFGRREKTLADREEELEKLYGEERRRLEQLAGMSAQDAKAQLSSRMEEEANPQAGNKNPQSPESAPPNADRERTTSITLP